MVDNSKTLNGNGIKFGKVDLSTELDLGVENNIRVTPTILMFKPDGSSEEYLGLRE